MSKPEEYSTSSSCGLFRHQQQRLLLLRHAVKCPHEDGRCPVTSHCAGLKRLWKHIVQCKDQKCLVSHCLSSRYVLSHHHRCKDDRCPVCGPVREIIHSSHEKVKQQQQKRNPSSNVAPSNRQPYLPKKTLPQPISLPNQTKSGFIQPQKPGSSNTIARGEVTSGSNFLGSNQVPGPNPQKDHTLINCFTTEQIETHIASLNNGLHLPSQKLKSECLELLKVLQAHPHGYVFNNPLDPVELGLPDYFEVIKHPMDLGTIKKRLENGYYHAFKDFESDVHLTFDNAMLYNQERSIVHKMAKEMKEKFISDYEKVIEQLNAEENQGRKSGDECTLNNNAMFQNQFNEMNVQQQNRGMKRKKDSDGDDKDDEENDFKKINRKGEKKKQSELNEERKLMLNYEFTNWGR